MEPAAAVSVVLVAADTALQALVRFALTGVGRAARFVAVTEGIEGLRAIATHRPDVVLLADDMGDVPAGAMVRSLRAQPETRDLTVVLLTPKAAPQGLELAQDGLVDAVVAVPVSPVALLGRILAAQRPVAG